MGIRSINFAGRDLSVLLSLGTFAGLSDGQLLGRFVTHRDDAAFEALIQRHGPMVWGICRRILRDYHDAEEAFQVTFLVLARKAGSIARREMIANWLCAVAYKTAMRARAMISKQRARERHLSEPPNSLAQSEARRNDLLPRLEQELERLPNKYRILIVLCEFEGKTHREAAELLDWPIGTVSGRLSRARAMLARRLTRSGMGLSVGSLVMALAEEKVLANLPTKLIRPTAQTASLSVPGQSTTSGMISANMIALMEGVLKSMVISKLKIVAALLLIGLQLAGSGIGLAYRSINAASTNATYSSLRIVSTSKQDAIPPEGGTTKTNEHKGTMTSTRNNLGENNYRPKSLEFKDVPPDFKNVQLMQTEEAIAAGVLEADEAAKGKSPQQIQTMTEELTATWKQRRLELQTTEAAIHRLDKLGEVEANRLRTVGARPLPREKHDDIVQGKTLEQIRERRNKLRAKWSQKYFELRSTEAAMRRLVRILSGNASQLHYIGIGKSLRGEEPPHATDH